MDKEAWALFISSALDNKVVVAINSLTEALFLVASVAFSVVLATAFGFDVFGLSSKPFLSDIAQDRGLLLVVAILLSVLALAARVVTGLLDAYVHSSREIWMARKMRDSDEALDRRTAARASNHYGRLASASMKATSSILVLLINLIILPIMLPITWAFSIFGLMVVIFVLLGYIFTLISMRMRLSSIGLVENARLISIWKTNPDIDDPPEVIMYQKAYFSRLFLSSIFSYSPWFFAFLFSIVLLIIYKIGWSLDFGEAFVGFTLAQMYLGLIGRLFNNAIKGAAFAPAISHYAHVVGIGSAPGRG